MMLEWRLFLRVHLHARPLACQPKRHACLPVCLPACRPTMTHEMHQMLPTHVCAVAAAEALLEDLGFNTLQAEGSACPLSSPAQGSLDSSPRVRQGEGGARSVGWPLWGKDGSVHGVLAGQGAAGPDRGVRCVDWPAGCASMPPLSLPSSGAAVCLVQSAQAAVPATSKSVVHCAQVVGMLCFLMPACLLPRSPACLRAAHLRCLFLMFPKQGQHDSEKVMLWWTFQAAGLGSVLLYMVGLLAVCPLLPSCVEMAGGIADCNGLWCLATPTTALLVTAVVACWGSWVAQAGWVLSCWRQDEGPDAQEKDQQEEAQVCVPEVWGPHCAVGWLRAPS